MTRPFEELAGQRVTVMGLGRFGGGVAAVNFLMAQGACVTLTDLQSADSLAEPLSQIGVTQLNELVLGEHRIEDFEQADLVVVNPAVNPARSQFLQAARAKGVRITSEIELFWERCPGKVIAVTGTVGKSTTASLIAHLLTSCGQVSHLGGNIGVSLLPRLEQIGTNDWVVLELSSFQLALLANFRPQPEIAVVTNLFPNHLDWHVDWDDYVDAKKNIVRWQCPDQRVVLNADDKTLKAWRVPSQQIWFGTDFDSSQFGTEIFLDHFRLRTQEIDAVLPFETLPQNLRIPHQRDNVAAALAVVAEIAEMPFDQIRNALDSFQSLPHRCEIVGTSGGVTFVNDSKSTIPEATIAAVSSLSGPIFLIAGGKDKKIDLAPMCRRITDKLQGVALIGETAAALVSEFRSCSATLPASQHQSLESAFRWCVDQALQGGTVLLSPGCASYPEFQNYEDRGNQFRRLVAEDIASQD